MEAVADESDYIAAAMAKVMGGKGAGQEHHDGGGEGGAGGEADGGKQPINIGPNVGGLRVPAWPQNVDDCAHVVLSVFHATKRVSLGARTVTTGSVHTSTGRCHYISR